MPTAPKKNLMDRAIANRLKPKPAAKSRGAAKIQPVTPGKIAPPKTPATNLGPAPGKGGPVTTQPVTPGTNLGRATGGGGQVSIQPVPGKGAFKPKPGGSNLGRATGGGGKVSIQPVTGVTKKRKPTGTNLGTGTGGGKYTNY